MTWLDDLCLEPITPVAGFSKLCNACIKIFRDDVWERNDYHRLEKHIRYSDVLDLSARRGCRLCDLLLTDIKKRASCLQTAMPSVLDLHFSRSSGKIYKEIRFWGMEVSMGCFTLSMYPVEGQSIPATLLCALNYTHCPA